MGYMNYEERLEVAKRLYELSNAEQKTALEYIFPELCESEDERIRKAIIELVRQSSEILCMQNQSNMIAWLEKQKPAWSKEDEIMIANIRDDLFCYQTKVRDEYRQLAEDIEKEIKWLKSLKERVQPKNHWKPSDDDINLLKEVEQALLGKDCHNRLVDFMWKLKKLKE